MKYIPVIGLEIHVELNTKSKMFCQCSANYFGKAANSNTCPVCLGMPGALPVPNEEAIKWTMLIGKALNCTINKVAKFDRKHYFYPDLTKGYQISQYDEPIAVKGFIELGPAKRKFRIHRVHLEEDTGKLMHSGQETLVDFNRSGVPLVEIVTEADFNNSEDVKEFLQELHTTIEYLNVSDADMEKGSMRLEPNISVRGLKSGDSSQKFELPNYKVEVKNINSFNFVKKAIDYEVKRHIEILERGETPIQETRGFVEADSSTKSQRTKEEAQDYRYFPEPDIPPLSFTNEFIYSIKVPELPSGRKLNLISNYHLKERDASILVRDNKLFDLFKSVLLELNKLLPGDNEATYLKTVGSDIKSFSHGQMVANYLINKKIASNSSSKEIATKIMVIYSSKLTDPKKIDEIVTKVIAGNSKVVEDIRKGKETAIMFLVGQVMREMKGQADAKTVISKLKAQISKETK